MATVWWDDPRQFRIDAGTGTPGGSVPEEIPRERWSDWDKATIGGYEIPGHVVVFSKKEKKNDLLSPMGQDGGTINHLGVEPVQLDLTITIWTPAQFVDYEKLVNLITPKAFPGMPKPLPAGVAGPPEDPTRPTAATSFEIRHPPLNMLGVTSVYIYEVGSLVPGPVHGSKVTVWRAMERKPETPIIIQVSTGNYSDQLTPSKKQAATQPVQKPSVSAVGP